MEVLFYDVLIPLEIARVTVCLLGERIFNTFMPPPQAEPVNHVQKTRETERAGRRSILPGRASAIFPGRRASTPPPPPPTNVI